MTLEELLSKGRTERIEWIDLRAVCSEKKNFGADLVEVLEHQRDVRRDTMQRLAAEGRDLLASEARDFAKAELEARQIGDLYAEVLDRGDRKYRPPTSVTNPNGRRVEEISPVLQRDQKFVDHVRDRYGVEREPGAFARVLGAYVSGNRDRLSEAERRDLIEGVDASGGFTVPTPLSAQFIDRLRNQAVVARLGAQVVAMESETLSIARVASSLFMNTSPTVVAPRWRLENSGPIDESELTLERVKFTAHTLPVLVRMSVELAEDSNSIGRIVETAIVSEMALELDRAALVGTGTDPEPKGVLHQSGVHVVNFNASVSDWDFLIDGITPIWSSNDQPNGFVANALLSGVLAKLKEATQKQPLRKPEAVAALTQMMSNQIPSAGTSPNTSSAYVANWNRLMIGMRTGLRMEISREAAGAFRNLQIVVRAYLRADVQLEHGESFSIVSGINV